MTDEEVWLRFAERMSDSITGPSWVTMNPDGTNVRKANDTDIIEVISKRADLFLIEFRNRFPKDTTPYRG